MKINKWYISIVMAVIIMITGCKTTSDQSLENKSKAVAWVATVKLLEKHPEWRPHFVTVRNDLQILEQSETLGIVEVLAIVHRLPVKELKSGDAALIIGATTLFFEDELGRLEVQNPEAVRYTVRGLIKGLTLAGIDSQ